MIVSRFYILLLAQALATSGHSADILADNINDNVSSIWIVGEIEKGDFEKFQLALRDLSSSTLTTVELRSPGGSPIEAMRIGQEIRSRFLDTHGPFIFPEGGMPVADFPDTLQATLSATDKAKFSACNSACFLVWAGGVTRTGIGRNPFLEREFPGTIGLHRPRFDSEYFAGLNASRADELYDELLRQIDEYLIEMDIPRAMIEKMVSVPSSSVYFLTSDEMEPIISPPSYDEWLRAKCGDDVSVEHQMDVVLLEQRQSEGETLDLVEDTYLRLTKQQHDAYMSCKYEAKVKEQDIRSNQ